MASGRLMAACSSAFVRTRARDCRLSGQRRKIVTECRLDPGAIFCLGRNVPPDGDQASGNRIDSSAQNGPVAFATTNWSVVLTAQDKSPSTQEELEKLCRPYCRLIYRLIYRRGEGREEAEDINIDIFVMRG